MILYMDLFSGISGDMTLGAFVDLGVPLEWLTQKLGRVLKGFELRSEIVFKHHFRAVNLFVDVTDTTTSRTYTDIKAIITDADLPDRVQQNSLAAFERIARAESVIHGRDLDQVHFHEIGGIDSLVDIIGCFLAVEYLGITAIAASKIPLGSGFVECEHGRIPVPVPATLAILKGIPVTGSDAVTEIVTPTGAALVATLATSFGPMPAMEIQATGYGAGKRETGSALPNVVRLVLGRPLEKPLEKPGETLSVEPEKVVVVQTNVDDMSPEIAGFVMEILLEKGALDVTFIPVHMKKNRPGFVIEVICRPHDREAMTRLILDQTTAIGVRFHTCERVVLARESLVVETGFGSMAVKKVTDLDGRVRILPEYEACRRVSLESNLPLKDVYARITAQLNPLDTDKGRL